MSDQEPFVDYYDILQVGPNCGPKVLEAAYHHLAKIYHPDHSGTKDTTKFNEVNEAYRQLRDPERRAEYDRIYAQKRKDGLIHSAYADPADAQESAALDDAEDHRRILLFLYKRRRENAQNAGVVGFYIQEMLGCSDERFDFHRWYLKEKGFIAITEQGTLAITIAGVDHVISMSRTTREEKLLIAQSDGAVD